jgi:hypothetical protein
MVFASARGFATCPVAGGAPCRVIRSAEFINTSKRLDSRCSNYRRHTLRSILAACHIVAGAMMSFKRS